MPVVFQVKGCQQCAAAAQYNAVMAGYEMGQGHAELAQAYARATAGRCHRFRRFPGHRVQRAGPGVPPVCASSGHRGASAVGGPSGGRVLEMDRQSGNVGDLAFYRKHDGNG